MSKRVTVRAVVVRFISISFACLDEVIISKTVEMSTGELLRNVNGNRSDEVGERLATEAVGTDGGGGLCIHEVSAVKIHLAAGGLADGAGDFELVGEGDSQFRIPLLVLIGLLYQKP